MGDYIKGKIYTIRCNTDENLIYVGSTIQSLSKRFGGHKIEKVRKPNTYFYTKVENWNDWYIELYENYPCQNREELNKREGEIIRLIGTLNINATGRTKKEYYEENKARFEEYYIENKEHITQIKKDKYKENKDDINLKNRDYYNENRERILEQKRLYYEKKKTIQY
jgi:hypothetical protein